MKLELLLFILSCIFLLANCNTTSHNFTSHPRTHFNGSDRPPNQKPGECYAKCLIPDQSETQSNFIAVYTGYESDEQDLDIEIKKVQTSPAKTEWVKKKANRNCLSQDPNDCLVWCLVETPAEFKEYKIVKDTSQTSDFEMVELKQEKLTKKGGFTEWRTILCESKMTKSVISEIQTSLKTNSYYTGEITGNLGSETRSALTKFQQKNSLPVGHLDFETLDALGVMIQ